MALMASAATVVAALCGVGALLLLLLYLVLRWEAQQKRKQAKARKARAKAKAEEANAAASPASADAPSSSPVRRPAAAAVEAPFAPASPPTRDAGVVKREAELKRDALHVFRKLQAGSSLEEKGLLCREAVALYDDIANRVGVGMAAVTSGRIVFCNALMSCGGLDELRELQDSNDPDAGALVERVVPIIFST